MKIINLSLRALQVVILLIGLIWLTNTIKMSGSYLVTQVVARAFGTSASGKIELISPNPELQSTANNYVARVSFRGTEGQSFTQEFRYADLKNQGKVPVTVYFLPSRPRIAALKDDDGYFYNSLGIFVGIAGFLIALFIATALGRRWALKKIHPSIGR